MFGVATFSSAYPSLLRFRRIPSSSTVSRYRSPFFSPHALNFPPFSPTPPPTPPPPPPLTSLPLPDPVYAPCVPSDASQIQDFDAQFMLRRLQYTPLQTSLPQSTIHTSHLPPSQTSAVNTPLLFLHGFDSNMLEFRHILPLLDAHPSVDAYFVDLLGWGLTEKPCVPGFSYAPPAKREHLRAYHDQVIGGQPIVLVGASIGGAAAVDFALAYPHLVSKLILLGPQLFTDKPASSLMTSFPAAAAAGVELLRSRWLRRIAVNLAYRDERFKSEDVLHIGRLHCYTEGWKQAAMRFVMGEGYCLSRRIEELQCDVLILWGEHDRVLPKGDVKKFQAALGDEAVVIVQDSGHCPHVEQPQIVMEHVDEFIKRKSEKRQ